MLFGEIKNGIIGFSEVGNAAACCLQEIPEKRAHVILDEFIVMPNHIHCILEVKDQFFHWENSNQYGKPVAGSVSVIINQYKGAVTKWCNKNNFLEFEWQGRFYDRVIRNNEEYWAIKNYIINNPENWQQDTLRRDLPPANPTQKRLPPANPSDDQ